MILGLVSNSEFNGDFKKSPFSFKNFNLNYISLSENEVQIPMTAYTPSYQNDLFVGNCLSLFADFGQHKTNVSPEDYKDNICLYVLDLKQDFSASDPFMNIARSGEILIHLKFDNNLPDTVTFVECIAARYKEIHLVNLSYTFRAVWFIMKHFFTDKLKQRMIFHKTPETLLNYFPKAVLPKQYGGDLESYDMSSWLKKAMAPEKLAALGGRPRQTND
ncbi:uncharacterized protein CEXT_745551 [Caerostris extrusa]|uniref:CRAL-TRIO domain-containing protein n=1 Tax=Caerostris extrusa TaxID=172846 RepID=A0AAV4QJB1_CAEEX|nr:uncharacterized protein CEXT_745551 [Caerostris extrusa]